MHNTRARVCTRGDPPQVHPLTHALPVLPEQLRPRDGGRGAWRPGQGPGALA